MIFIICTCLFMIMSFAFAFFGKKRIEETLAPTAMIIILILYISGLFQNLLIGVYFIIGIAIVSFISMLYKMIKNHDFTRVKRLITPGFFVFIIFIFINMIVSKGRWLYAGDEFSHWGRATLNMYKWNKFGNCVQPMTLVFPGYPPVASLWGYFFVCLKSTFSEAYLYAAQNMLAFAFLISLYKKIDWKYWKKALFLLIALFIVPLIFYGEFWESIYVDGLLGIWLFYILYTYFSEKENTVFKIFRISLALATYPLLKASGTGLAFLSILIITMDMLVFGRLKSERKKKFGILFTYVASVLVGKQSWSLFLKLIGSKSAWNESTISVGRIIDFLGGHAEPHQYTTVYNFFYRFFFVGGWSNGKFTAIDWILIIIALSVFMYILKIWSRKETLCYIGSFVLCIGLYSAFLLMLYCFTFGAYEGPHLASYDRYMGSILLGIIGFIIFTFIIESHGTSEKVILTVLLCIMVPFSSIESYTIKLEEGKEKRISQRLPYENIKEFPDFMDWKKDQVYIIEQGSSGTAANIGSYNAIPVVCGKEWGWSLGPALFEGDVWSVDYSVEEWESVLLEGEYTYVYIAHQDEQFVSIYSDLFENPKEIEDRGLYKIYEDKGTIHLKLFKQY